MKQKLINHWSYSKFILLVFFLLFLGNSQTFATHLIGGNVGYEYIGPDPLITGNSLYRITLDAYQDCNSSNWVNGSTGGTFPEPAINVGIYEGILNPTNALSYTNDIDLLLIDSNAVDPNLPDICDPFNLLANVCVYLIRYEETISLAPSSLGYWIVYDRCCRPGGILNLNNSGSQSFAYTTWIPSIGGALINNTSAQFTDTLLSYICRTDSAYISNNAIDPDGDSLVYSLETPFTGLTGQGGTAPPPSAAYFDPLLNPYTFPPPFVNYQAGYSLANLLGTGSYSSINDQTGLTTFLTNSAGIFVASVEIKEYRNGVVVGVTRRNMQLISDNCPNNNQPNQNTSNLDSTAVSPLVYEVEAGLNICFDLDYDDLDNDPLKFTATSDIFNSTLTNPAATVTSPITGIGSVTGTICWNTTCAQGSTTSYLIDVVVSDSNCPPLPLPQEVYIKVLPFEGPETIFGDTIICIDNNPSLFTTDTIAGVNYNWTVIGGTITSGNGSSSINVLWTPGQTTGSLSISSTNQNGCIAGPISRNVILSDVVSDAGTDQVLCEGIPVIIGGAPTSQDPNNTITWSPALGLDDPSLANPTASPDTTTTYVVTLTNALGCIGKDSVIVTINNLVPSGILGDYFLCPGDTLQMNAVGTTFNWGPNAFISSTTISNPKVFPAADQQYFLNYFDVNGCEGDDTTLITVNATVPTEAGPDITYCEGDSVTLGGSPTGPVGTTYTWSPNTNMNDNTLENPRVSPIGSTTYTVITSNDTCSGIDSITVIELSKPILSVSPDTYICGADTVQLSATGTGGFVWSNGTTLSDSTISNPLAFPAVPTMYTVTLSDVNACLSIDSVFVSIQPLPIVDAGVTVNACKFLPASMGGSPSGPTGASYLWTPSTGLNFNGLANPLVTLDSDATYILQVTDTFGCIAFDTVDVEVFRVFGTTDTTICNNVELELKTTIKNGVGPYSYIWSPANLVSDPTSDSPTIVTGAVDNFTVTVTDANSCKDTLNFNIQSLASTTASFEYETLPTCDGIGVKIKENSSGATAYEWLVDGETVSTEENPLLVFGYDKIATVALITTSIDGCIDTAEVTVEGPSFDSLADIQVSNVFTPNGDGMNDYFEITSNGNLSDCIELTIFNRAGGLVHQSNGGIHSWDGRSSTGIKFPDGVYFYIYSINGSDYQGTLTLMRSN